MSASRGAMLGEQAGARGGEMVAQLGTEAYSRTPKMSCTDDNSTADVRTPSMSTDWIRNTEGDMRSSRENLPVSTSASGTASTFTAPTSSNTSTSTAPTLSSKNSTTDLDLLLIGKSGVGKSATGNSILRKKMFKSSASLHSETDKISAGISKVNGRIVKVVDGPGVGDTRMDTEDGIRFFVESIEHAMITNPAGYHALLLVLRFGTRFTQEDEDTVMLLKKVFGPDFVRKYCIIVVTCGDLFKYEEEDTGEDFHQWVAQQEGKMANLVAECQGRIVLFDNVTKSEEEKTAQMDQLLEALGRLDNNGERYTDSNFEAAMNAREKLIAESKVPIARDATLQALMVLMHEFGDIRDKGIGSEDPAMLASSVKELERLLNIATALKEDVTAQDMGTGALKDLMGNVDTVERSIQSSLTLHRELMESRRQQLDSERELTNQMEELQQEMANVDAEEEKQKLVRENEMLKLQLQQLMKQRQDIAIVMERQDQMYRDFQRSEQRFYQYQAQREGFFRKNLRKTYRMFRKGANFVFSITKAR